MKKLDFIIVGAMKAGTSSLELQLTNHPAINMPMQELHFFDNDENYNKGYSWYHHYFNNFNKNDLWGEKTPTYSYLKKVAKRIYEYNPKIKLIWIFRNPIERAYSNYWHSVKKGTHKFRFKKTIEKEDELIQENIFYGYLKRSIYHKQVKHYLKYFSHNQMHYLLFEKFINDPLQELKKIFSFLDLTCPDNYEYIQTVRNKTMIPRFPRFLRKTKDYLGPNSLVYRVFRFLATKGKKPGYPKMSDQVRKKLKHYFKKHNQELKELTNLEVSLWG